MARRALIHRVESQERRGRVVGSLAVLLSIAVLGSTWVGLFAFLGGSAAHGTFQDVKQEWIPDTEQMELELPELSSTSRIYAGSGELLAELHDGRQSEPVPYEEMPQVLLNAIIAAEDEDFFEHDGWDPEATAAALRDTVSGTLRGGSTITQQVVKNAFVGDDVTLKRKVNELFVSLELERDFSKEEILEYYANSVYFGAGAYGVKAAANEYFEKELEDLDLAEAATLAVTIRNPGVYDPRNNPEDVKNRRDNTILREMEENGHISAAARNAASEQPLGVIDNASEEVANNRVAVAARAELLSNPEFSFLGETLADRKHTLFGCPANDTECTGGGGLTIETTVDMDLQNMATDILQEWFPLLDYNERTEACSGYLPNESAEFIADFVERETCQVTGAMTMIKNDTGAVKVMASALPFEFNQFDLALQARRNPGSSFKPFGLVAALESGITLGERYDGSSPQSFDCDGPCSPSGNQWTVQNAGLGSYGNITLEEATYNSVNTVYAQVGVEVGASNIADAARRMGIRSPLTEVPSLVLGTSAVSTMEMASAYSNFATNGVWAEPYLIEKIIDREGTILYERQVQPKQVIDATIAAAARRPLLVVPVSGTAPQANIDREQGGKTGTHQNYTDAWYVGFTPRFSTAVWAGFSHGQEPMENITINGEHFSRVYGGSLGAPIWAEFMGQALENVREGEFPDEPENIDEFVRPPLTTVPNVVGLDSGAAAAELEGARLNYSVSEVPSREPEGIVVGQEYGAGARVEEGTTVTISVSNGEVPSGSMPDVVGLSQEDALAVLGDFQNNAGIRIEVFGREVPVEDRNRIGKIVGQSPSPGSAVDDGDRVILEIGVALDDDGDDGDGGDGGDDGDGGDGGDDGDDDNGNGNGNGGDQGPPRRD